MHCDEVEELREQILLLLAEEASRQEAQSEPEGPEVDQEGEVVVLQEPWVLLEDYWMAVEGVPLQRGCSSCCFVTVMVRECLEICGSQAAAM